MTTSDEETNAVEGVITLVRGELTVGDGATFVFKKGVRTSHLESEEAYIGFCEALDVLKHPYTVINLDVEDWTIGEEWQAEQLAEDNLVKLLDSVNDEFTVVTDHYHGADKISDDGPIIVQYFGFDPSMSDFLADPKFAEILERNGYSLTDENSAELDYSQVSSSSVWVYDPGTNTGFAVLHDGIAEARVVTYGFAEILKRMDEYLQERDQKRLILIAYADGNVAEVDEDHPAYDWEFDFEVGKYVSKDELNLKLR